MEAEYYLRRTVLKNIILPTLFIVFFALLSWVCGCEAKKIKEDRNEMIRPIPANMLVDILADSVADQNLASISIQSELLHEMPNSETIDARLITNIDQYVSTGIAEVRVRLLEGEYSLFITAPAYRELEVAPVLVKVVGDDSVVIRFSSWSPDERKIDGVDICVGVSGGDLIYAHQLTLKD